MTDWFVRNCEAYCRMEYLTEETGLVYDGGELRRKFENIAGGAVLDNLPRIRAFARVLEVRWPHNGAMVFDPPTAARLEALLTSLAAADAINVILADEAAAGLALVQAEYDPDYRNADLEGLTDLLESVGKLRPVLS